MNRMPGWLAALLLGLGFSAGIGAPPNVIVLMPDDQGWGDLSLHGNTRVRTPHIDRLFQASRQFRNFMTWCVCSPTRAGFLTGRHPMRLGAGPNVGGELALEETTIAEFFKSQGYRTGVFGKWHNGSEPDVPEFRAAFKEAHKALPNKVYEFGHGANAHGFDRSVVYYGGGPDKFTRVGHGGRLISWFHDHHYRPEEQGYLSDLITRYASDFIRREAGRGQPFFAHVAFDQVHHPLQAKPEHLAMVSASVTNRAHRIHSAMLLALDESVGKLIALLEELKIRENTIIWYFSDNGGLPEGSSLPFKGFKHKVLEGGIHVPASISWPSGGLTNGFLEGMVGYLDVLPTLAGLLEKPLITAHPVDGADCSALIRGARGVEIGRDYYWGWRENEVVRTDRWKLFRHWDRYELFDLKHDPLEESDVASANPSVVEELAGRLDYWRKELGSASPVVAPDRHGAANPEGEVLEFMITQTDRVEAGNALRVHFANRTHQVGLGDVVEFDVLYPRGPFRRSGSFVSPYRDGEPPVFNGRRGLDQFGRLQMSGPMPAKGPGFWEHRAIAMGHEAPLMRSLHAAYFHGVPGTHKFYLDNLKIVRGDGRVVWIWRSGEDSRLRETSLPAQFSGLSIRPVSVGAIPAGELAVD